MKLKDLLLEKKSAILGRWFDTILETYPADTSRFLKSQKNRFANPVGSTILEGIEGIFNEILQQDVDSDRISTFLDNIIRIRAVQNFDPSRALAFIFILKKVIREELDNVPELNSGQENKISEELLEFESQIDGLALIAFDIYMKCREKIYEIKANEVKRRTFRLLQLANLITENQGEKDLGPDFKENNFSNL